jgi:hypothetical protein
MEFLINESQLRVILKEQDESRMSEYMKMMRSFTKNLAIRVNKVYGLNMKMLLTWGTSVGGLVMPLDQFIKSGNFDLSDDQRYLVLAGITFMLFFDNKKELINILSKIKEEGLEDVFRTVLEKGKDLKSAFKGFLSSINVSVGSFMDTVAYAFLIPIILDLQHIAEGSMSPKEAGLLIAERLISSGVVIIGVQSLSQVIRKIIERLK